LHRSPGCPPTIGHRHHANAHCHHANALPPRRRRLATFFGIRVPESHRGEPCNARIAPCHPRDAPDRRVAPSRAHAVTEE
jgi:hypothetical protein